MKPHYHVRVNGEMKADLDIWTYFLAHPDVYSRPFLDFQESNAVDIDMYTDASRNFLLGCGGFCGTSWFWQRWDIFTAKVKPSIEYLELYAVTVAVMLWISKFRNMRVQLFCDNRSAVDMINGSTSSCKNCMVLIRLIVLEGLKKNAVIKAKHVSSKANAISDALSRFQYSRFKFLTKKRMMDKLPTNIPTELWPIGKIWLK